MVYRRLCAFFVAVFAFALFEVLFSLKHFILLPKIREIVHTNGNFSKTKSSTNAAIEKVTQRPSFETTLRVEIINPSVQRIFENIAKGQVWGGGKETKSGTGSLLASTVSVRKCLGEWIKFYNISSVMDVPCGDANWQRFIPGISDISYRGFDISPHVVHRARQKNPDFMKFGILDITSNIPPRADLVLMRDVIQHLPLKLGQQAIQNVLLSGAKWLAVSSYNNVNYPRATRCGGDIVTLLWFRASVRAWFRPSVGRPCEHDRD